MKQCGYDIHVIAKIHHFQDQESIKSSFSDAGIPLTLVPHPRSIFPLFLQNIPAILRSPALLDGAALEYADPAYESVVTSTVESLHPDVIWMEYTTHWPVLRLLKRYDIPVIMKSSLNEPRNCIDEHGGSLLSHIKALPKYAGENISARESDLVLAITPDEEQWYRSLGAKQTMVLPLRGLSQCFREKVHKDKDVLDVVFLSSNYNMGHNRDALRFLLEDVVPLAQKELRQKFRFHLTGKKFPQKYMHHLSETVKRTGFIDDLGAFLSTMDIALCPWISGQGMQQKVFEPLCRSLPTITTKTGGYPFVPSVEILLCHRPEEYVGALRRLLTAEERNRMSRSAYERAKMLFSERAVTTVMQSAIQRVLQSNEDSML